MKIKAIGIMLFSSFLLMVSVLMVSAADGIDIAINEMNFPDAVFREYVSSNFDSDSDGVLSQVECSAAESINIYGITSLEGIEYFTNLTYLSCNNNHGLSTLDLSENTALESLSCHSTGITSLDISKNTALKELVCHHTGITSLDVSNNIELVRLICNNTKITSLDISKNTALKNLVCYETGIACLDFSNNMALRILDWELCPNTYNIGKVGAEYDLANLPGFDVTRASDWVGATCENGKLTQFMGKRVTYNYDCGNDYVIEFAIEHEHNYVDCICITCGVKKIAISEENFPDKVFRNYVSTEFDSDLDGMLSADEVEAVTYISINNFEENSVISFKGIEYFTKLVRLDCSSNIKLMSIDVSKNVELEWLNISLTGIANLDLSNNPKLKVITGNTLHFGKIGSSYDLNSHPGFDVTKVFDCTGATYKDGILTNFIGEEGSYRYDCGNGCDILIRFSHEHNYIDGICITCGSEGIAIDEINFPDENFRNFVLEYFDTNQDNIFSVEERNDVTLITLRVAKGGSVTSLKGIEYMPELKWLKCAGAATEMSELDISNNPKLTYLECNGTGITSLDVSNNPVLGDLHCGATRITSLDVSNNPELVRLNCSWTGITSLDVSNNPVLGGLYCYGTRITSLDVSNNPELVSLGVSYTDIASLDVSNNPELENLFIDDTSIMDIDLSNNKQLLELNCANTGITSLDVSANDDIIWLDCSSTGITSLDVSANGDIAWLYCSGTGITSLDVSNNVNLILLDCANTGITSLDVSNNAGLKELNCSSTKITSLDVSNNVNLILLDCANTGITNLDVSANERLEYLYCANVGITSLDVSANERLEYLYCANVGITSLDVSNNADLKELNCSSTKITSLDISNNVNLILLDCANTGITELDVSKNEALYELHCNDTKLTSLDISDIIREQISYIDCSGTEITELNLENGFFDYLKCSDTKLKSINLYNAVVYELDCSNTEITELNFSYPDVLRVLNCSNTGITSLNLERSGMLKKLNCSNTGITSLDLENSGGLTELYCSNTKLTNLRLRDCPLEVLELNDNVFYIEGVVYDFDLSSLPGFDVRKASEWVGATYKDGRLINFTDTKVTYKYDCGMGILAEFTFILEEKGTDGLVDFVNRMYSIILERTPDAGSQTWVELLRDGSYTGAQVAEGFIMSEEFLNKDISNEEFVKIMYCVFLNREADARGLEGWTELLDGGYIKKFIFAGFANSQEFKAVCEAYGIDSGKIKLTIAERTPNLSEQDFNIWQFVERLYSEVMGRNPDQTGMDTWVGVLKSGEYTGAQAAEGFIMSDEFLNKDMTSEEYVRIMYRAFFDRDADAIGLETWTGALANGWTKRAVFAGFANSDEFGVLCDAYGITQGSVEAE